MAVSHAPNLLVKLHIHGGLFICIPQQFQSLEKVHNDNAAVCVCSG